MMTRSGSTRMLRRHWESERVRGGDTTEPGSLATKAWVIEGIHLQVAAMGACVGRWEPGHVVQAKSFGGRDSNIRIIWWQNHGNGSQPYEVIPLQADPVGGIPAWMGVPAALSKT